MSKSQDSSPIIPTRMSFPTSPDPNYLSAHQSQPDLSLSPRPLINLNSPTLPSSPRQEMEQGDDVSHLLAGLRIDNSTQAQVLSSHSQAIAELQTESRRTREEGRKTREKVRDLHNLEGVDSDLANVKAKLNIELLQIRNAIHEINTSVNVRLGKMESRPMMVAPAKEPLDVPYFSHIFFSGKTKETNLFFFFAREGLITYAPRFRSEKHKIMWIASYFCYQHGKLGDLCPSYNWWRLLLGNNAVKQGLDASKASLTADYVMDELKSAEHFLIALEKTFTNH